MNCIEIHEQLVDVAGGVETPLEVQNHLHGCTACTQALEQMRKTMTLLDEWQAPEPSPYFDVRLQARLREEQRKGAASWLDWFRKPALGFAAVLLIAAGVGLYEYNETPNRPGTPVSPVQISRGTAVGDLQFLDKNSDILQDFDALDELDGTVENAPEMN